MTLVLSHISYLLKPPPNQASGVATTAEVVRRTSVIIPLAGIHWQDVGRPIYLGSLDLDFRLDFFISFGRLGPFYIGFSMDSLSGNLPQDADGVRRGSGAGIAENCE